MNTNMLSFSYWFNFRPELLPKTGVVLLALVGLACIYLIYLANNKQKTNNPVKPLWHRAENFAITNLVLSWFLAFSYLEALPFFSAKFWLPLWIIINLAYGFFFYKKVKNLPARLEKIKLEKEFKKYIPKKAR